MSKTNSIVFLGAMLCILLGAQPTNAQVPSGYLSNDQISGSALGVSDKAAVVLIHGWNPYENTDQYAHGEWPQLVNALSSRLNGSDWKLLLFHWENDASTGWIADLDIGETGFSNAREAANNALHNGRHLAEILTNAAPELRHVILIAHSAGSWAAYRAATKLLDYNPYVVINVALLDPFIPGVDTSIATPLDTSLMGQLDDHSDSARIFRIDNYYAIDPQTDYDSVYGEGGGLRATSQTFNWRSRDINHRVDYVSALPAGVYYKSHGGPIRFYADTVAIAGGASTPAGLAFAPWEFTQVGWYRSLSYEWFLLPRIQAHPQTQARALGSAISLSVTATDSRPLYYRWYRNGVALSATGPTYSFTLSELNAGEYVVCVSNINGMVFSDKATISIDNNIASPSSLSATPASSSQINLTWIDNSPNETGFKVERRLGSSGSWSQIATRPANVTTYSDTGRAAGTMYQYRVRAYNGSGDSAFSSIASATTLSEAGTIHTLTIRSVNPSSGLDVSSYVYANGSLFAFGKTPTTRTFAHGTGLGINCFPTTLSSGYVFQKWLLDGADYDFSASTVLHLDRDRTLTAVYGSSPLPPRNLSSLTIEGPSSVDERSSAQYRARANYSDGSSGYVIASWDEGSGYATISASGLLDTDSVSSDRDIEVEASFTLNGVTRSDTKNVTIENTDAVPTYTLTRNSTTGGSIGQSPSGTTFAEGTVVSLHGNADDGYVFSHWTGDASGTEDDITITMNRNRSVTANFTGDTSYGRLQVNLSPPQAVNEGAQWKYNTFTAWRDSGNIQDGITPRTNKNVYFKDIPGWITPDNIKASVVGGQTTVKSATYREILGAVQVTVTPEQAKAAGARWRVDGGSWTESGVTLNDISTGNHTVQYLAVAGWTTPQIQTVTVSRGVTTTVSGDYLPPAGYPVITAIYPKTGPIDGGTTITIDGINFQAGATVTFGGVTATSVAVVSPTRITAVTPARTSYGTVSLSLTSGGQTVTEANGFSYLNALGSNIELVGQIGGGVWAVAVAGKMVYYGEGSCLVVSDFSNTAAPVERGRIALPASVKDLIVVSNIVFVAAGPAGLYAVNVSVPTAPAIVGFYDTEGSANGVAVSGGIAYVADYAAGLQILDVGNPAAIVRLGLLDTAGNATRVSVGAIASKQYAFVTEYSSGAALRIIDVTVPSTPIERTSVPALSGVGFTDVKLTGTNLYVSFYEVVKIYDVSNPTNLIQKGTYGNIAGAFIDVVGSRLYTCDGHLQVGNLAVMPNPTTLGDYNPGNFCYDLTVASNLAFVAMGSEGLKVVNVSNPASMSLRSVVQTVGYVETLSVTGDVAFVGGDSGLHSLNVSNPARPIRLATLSGDRVTDMAVESGKATLVSDGAYSVRIANVANPTSLSIVGTYTNVRAHDVALMVNTPVVVGETKYVSGAPSLPKLDLLNLSIPSAPQSTGALVLDAAEGMATAISVVGNWAYVGRNDKALDVVSLANPTSPQKIGSIAIAGYYYDVAASEDGNWVFVGDWSRGIQVVNATVKSAPILGQMIDPPQTSGAGAQAVRVSGNRLFAYESGYIFVFDISNPASPQTIGYYDVPGGGREINVVGDLIFVAGTSAGLNILRLKDVDKPMVTITSPTVNASYSTNTALLTLGGTASDAQQVIRVSWANNRGGGGSADGTTNWQVASIQMAAGVNVISVTAEDANGNLATDILTVNANLPDTTPPVVTITGPKPDSEFTVNSPIITLSGTVADNVSVAGMSCSNNLALAGIVDFTSQTWAVTNVQLSLGANIIQVSAIDSAGNSSTDSTVIFLVPPDTNVPLVKIDFPTPNSIYETSIGAINLSGIADDDGGIESVEWSSSIGTRGVVNGTSPWSVNGIVLKPGFNLIEIRAIDRSGNESADTLSAIYTPPDVTLAGVQGISNGAFSLDLFGPWGANLLVESSSNLLDWIPLSTNVIPGEDAISITVPTTNDLPILFYRAISE